MSVVLDTTHSHRLSDTVFSAQDRPSEARFRPGFRGTGDRYAPLAKIIRERAYCGLPTCLVCRIQSGSMGAIKSEATAEIQTELVRSTLCFHTRCDYSSAKGARMSNILTPPASPHTSASNNHRLTSGLANSLANGSPGQPSTGVYFFRINTIDHNIRPADSLEIACLIFYKAAGQPSKGKLVQSGSTKMEEQVHWYNLLLAMRYTQSTSSELISWRIWLGAH